MTCLTADSIPIFRQLLLLHANKNNQMVNDSLALSVGRHESPWLVSLARGWKSLDYCKTRICCGDGHLIADMSLLGNVLMVLVRTSLPAYSNPVNVHTNETDLWTQSYLKTGNQSYINMAPRVFGEVQSPTKEYMTSILRAEGFYVLCYLPIGSGTTNQSSLVPQTCQSTRLIDL